MMREDLEERLDTEVRAGLRKRFVYYGIGNV